MEHFLFMKECLKEFNYPKIHTMDDLEVIDIFAKANREFLVGWMFKQLDEDYNEIVDKADKEELAVLVYCNGFCNDSEKNVFMNGECESSMQMNILYKMFKFLKDVSDSKKNADVRELKEVEECLHFNTNLFPMYGAKQTLSSEERAKKIQNYRKEIDHLKDLSAQQQTEDEYLIDPGLRNQLVATMKNIQANFPGFKRNVLEIMKNREFDSDKYSFSEDFSEILAACDENVEAVLEFIKSMNVVTNFEQTHSQIESVFPDKSNMMIQELAELCNEISALKKENNI